MYSKPLFKGGAINQINIILTSPLGFKQHVKLYINKFKVSATK